MNDAQQPINALPQGYRLQEYELVRVLGFGGFGMTYLGFDHNLDKPVAIKEYLPSDIAIRTSHNSVVPQASEFQGDFDWGLERFLDEARTLARFDHRHLVKVYRFFQMHNTAYIVMEYAEGETLSAYLNRKGVLTESELKAILNPILDGLATVHRADFLHRDIKPGNIVIRAEDRSPVLIDFGAARQAVGAKSRSVTSIVTPGYAPIEQYESRGNQGPWTDIYALGCVCYRALTDDVPIPAMDRVRRDPLIPVSERCKGHASQQFLAAIDHALQVDETARPQTVSEWRAELGDMPVVDSPVVDPPELTDPPVDVPPPVPGPQISSPSVVEHPEPARAQEPIKEYKGFSRVMWIALGVLMLVFMVLEISDYVEEQRKVEIPDTTLRAVIERRLGKARGAPITPADMVTLRRLDALNKYIKNLTGLEFATNLESLLLGSNQISDITALAGLTNLQRLLLISNGISDLAALSGLTNLTTLELGDNQISDITALSGLTNLTWLGLGNNQISDIAAIATLTKLEWLDLRYNKISDSDLSVLSGLTNLARLDLDNTQISDIAAIATLTNLTTLELGDNQISDITALSKLTNLTTLYQIEFILSYYYLLFFVVLPYCAEVSMWIAYPNQITESPEALLREEKRLKATPMADRVRFLRLLKSATCPTQTQVADLLGYDVRTWRRWWRCYRTEGLPGLLAQAKKRGAKERITALARAALLAAMKQGEIATMEEARQLLQTQFGVVYRSVSSLSKWCQRHGIKRKTGRPVHVKTDRDRQETFKKTSPRS